MKKLFVLFLVFMLLLAPAAPAEGGPEPPANSAEGDWYADLNGIPLRLSLNADGTYALALPSVLGESPAGRWEMDDIFVRLDDGPALALVSADLLIWKENDLLFAREAPRLYVPADLLPDAVPGLFAGYWTCRYVDVDGFALPADALDERTDLYIEDARVALGGPRFGDVFWTFSFTDGVLSADLDGRAVALALQQDGLMRLTCADDGTTLYLAPADPGARTEGEG